MPSRPFRSLSILAVALAAFALVGAACTSNSEKSSEKDDEAATAANADESTTGDDTGDTGNDTGNDTGGGTGDFATDVAAAQAQIEGAKDPCELYAGVAALANVSNPTTKDETRAAVEFYVAMLTKMAETSSDPAVADALSTGAKNFSDYATSVDYDPEKMNLNGTGPEIENADALDEAMNTYAQTEFSNCAGLAGPAPSEPPS